jgi:endonuclease/exonuclease/phosphatase (EEP) superfamily protein YafD
MSTLLRRRLRAAAFAAGLAAVASAVLRGFGPLDLLARTNGIPEWVLRAAAIALLVGGGIALRVLRRRGADFEDALLWRVVIGLSGATILGSLGSLSWWLELFSHFRIQYAAGLLSGALYFAIRRNAGGALLATAMAAANLYVASPQLLFWPRLAADRGETVRLAAANLHRRNREAESVLRFVYREAPDVLLLTELTPEWRKHLEPFLRSYPHSVVVPREDGHGIALYSRLPILSSEVLRFEGAGVPSLAARIDVRGRPLLVLGAHPPAPRNPQLYRVRNRIYAGLAGRARASEEPVVVLGDLNSTSWGRSFGRLLEEGGLRDTSEGRGFQWSWPAGFWPLAIPIDHCLTSPEVRIASRRIGSDIGSDHYPLIVDLAVGIR